MTEKEKIEIWNDVKRAAAKAPTWASTEAPYAVKGETIMGELVEAGNFDAALYGEDVGAGFKSMGVEDFTIPFIKLIQKLSPELDPGKQEYNEDVREGDFINSATGFIYGPKLTVVVANYARKTNEWKPRHAGGGLVASYVPKEAPTDTKIVDINGVNKLARQNGNILEESFYYYVMTGDDFNDRGVVSFKGSGIKVAKRFNMTMIAQRVAVGGKLVPKPMFSQVYELTSARQQNAKGSWMAVSIRRIAELDPSGDVYAAAKAFHDVALGAKLQEKAADDHDEETPKTNF